MFCSESEWVGKYPECLKSTNDYDSEYDEIEVKLCSDAKKCEHKCVVTENGAEICQCHQGFLLDPKTNLCQDIDECKSEGGFLIFQTPQGDDWIWCGFALIAYLGDSGLGDWIGIV